MFEYDLSAARVAMDDREGIFRYEAWLPVQGVDPAYAADVGRTPIVNAPERLSAELDVALTMKLEGGNPTLSFKDRGLSIAVALGRALGATRVCLPTQGNAGVAAALFSARLSLPPCLVYMPERHRGSRYHLAAQHFGADVCFFGANIADAGGEMRRVHRDAIAAGEYLDVSTFWEPGRLEGKKTMGLEIVEHFGQQLGHVGQHIGNLPKWILYPTGGGTGLVGIWKAMIELGVPLERRPKMVAVQSMQCAPVVRAFERGLDHVERITSEGTIADGLDVPGAIMGHGILDAVRTSGGTAIAVSEASIKADFATLGRLGVSASYEAAATLAALRVMRAKGTIAPGDSVLLLVTAGHAVAL
jgi:threonine synthase